MGMRNGKQAWIENVPLRLRLETAAWRAYPGMERRFEGRRQMARVVYRLVVSVPEYEQRRIELHFKRTTGEPRITRIYADGPDNSPHRYAPHSKDPLQRSSLCVWYDDDPPEQRWVPADGLLALINHTRVHLFKEGYWRETGEWPGPEGPHASATGAKLC
jgi:hypothetical protein